jgi:hypothetical protein
MPRRILDGTADMLACDGPLHPPNANYGTTRSALCAGLGKAKRQLARVSSLLAEVYSMLRGVAELALPEGLELSGAVVLLTDGQPKSAAELPEVVQLVAATPWSQPRKLVMEYYHVKLPSSLELLRPA